MEMSETQVAFLVRLFGQAVVDVWQRIDKVFDLTKSRSRGLQQVTIAANQPPVLGSRENHQSLLISNQSYEQGSAPMNKLTSRNPSSPSEVVVIGIINAL